MYEKLCRASSLARLRTVKKDYFLQVRDRHRKLRSHTVYKWMTFYGKTCRRLSLLTRDSDSDRCSALEQTTVVFRHSLEVSYNSPCCLSCRPLLSKAVRLQGLHSHASSTCMVSFDFDAGVQLINHNHGSSHCSIHSTPSVPRLSISNVLT